MNRKQRLALEQAALTAAVDVGEADRILERVYAIAEDLATAEGRIPAHRARRAGRRICNLIDQVDEALGLDEGEDNGER